MLPVCEDSACPNTSGHLCLNFHLGSTHLNVVSQGMKTTQFTFIRPSEETVFCLGVGFIRVADPGCNPDPGRNCKHTQLQTHVRRK